MRFIDRCVYKELFGPFLLSLAVLTFIVFTRELGRFAELLIRKGAEPSIVLQVCFSLFPSILIFTVPMSFLIGTLIAFSRLSSDSEIIAFRACGVGTTRMLSPVLKVGILVFAAGAALTLFLLPYGNRHLLELRYLIGVRPVVSDIRPRVFNEDIAGMILYVEQIQHKQDVWDGVFVADNSAPGQQRIILAKQGRIAPQPEQGMFQLHFDEGTIYKLDTGDYRKDNFSVFRTLEMSVRVAENGSGPKRPLRAEEKTSVELLTANQQTAKEQRLAAVELNRRLALPLSTFAFAFLGLALGVNTRRGGRAYGFLLGLVITFTYFILFVSGSGLAKDSHVPIWIGVWGSNILLYGGSLAALRLMHRNSSALRLITDNRLLVGSIERTRWALDTLRRKISRRPARTRGIVFPLRLSPLKVIDLYLIGEFLKYFFLILGAGVALFIVFTLFELVDDIVSHHVAWPIILDYFWYLLPFILTLVVPLSVLIAALVSFGLLERTNQITSLKASGVSVYRLAAPIFMTATVLSGLIFVMQDYVLPFANQKQDNLRSVIKGRAVGTFYHPDRQWIFGQQPRLYNYVRYDSSHNEFAALSIYDLDIGSNRFNSRIYASRAVWDSRRGGWVLFRGFFRDFNNAGRGMTSFDETFLRLPEGPSYFSKEVKESSKMPYGELKSYIHSLQQSGFDVEELRVELYRKISFPVVSLIMAILGLPFAFSVGRRGALHGLAFSILIGMIYWGAFGVFEVLGASGMLAPVLAAWAPNLLFGTGGLYLLLTVRT